MKAEVQKVEDGVDAAQGLEQFNVLADCRHGRMVFNRHDRYLGRSLLTYGEFSQGEGEFFEGILRPGDVVLEAGANIGAHTVHLSALVGPTGAVLAFEPQRLAFQCLCANTALNSLDNVWAQQAALGETPGTLLVPVLDPRQENNVGGLEISGHTKGEPVPVETIDRLALTRLNLLKADVEGMEVPVLRGAENTISRLRPILYVENDRREKSSELIRLIREFGYRLWWHLPPLFNQHNWRNVTENLFPNLVSINMFCVPAEGAVQVVGAREVAGADDWPFDGGLR